jgi:hypothetical protein
MDRHRRKLQIIFQDPYASLNPRITVGDAIGEPLIAHGLANAKAARERVLQLLDVVGLAPFHYNRYPHEFPAGSASAWNCPPWCWNPNSSSLTSPCRRSMFHSSADHQFARTHSGGIRLDLLFISHDLGSSAISAIAFW